MLKDNQESFCLLLVDFKQWIPLILLCVVLMVSGCATAPPRNPIPEEIGGSGDIYGIVDVRWWSDEAPPMIEEWMKLSPSVLKNKYSDLFGKVHNYLAISGGGADGAFGAGLLVGWTEAGTRPEFGFVTGISTGALIAPFAFLGPAYDAQLKEVYTQYSTSDLIEKRGLFKIIKNDAAAGTDGLRSLLAEYIDEKMMKALAAEYRRGRTLDIGTTNLDAARPVTWNVTRIAASGHPKALELIRQILLASASIPVAFPPVYIEIEKDGQLYDEMHVDGGATSQVYLYPPSLDWRQVLKKVEAKGTPHFYVIRNSRLATEWKSIEPRVTAIAGRSISSLIRTQGIGDLFRLYLVSKRDGIDFNLAYIPDDFEDTSTELFDPVYMGKLFDLGYRMGKAGYPWKKKPPGYALD